MGVLVTTCPHCHAEQMTFDLFGPAKYPKEWPVGRDWAVPAAGECRGCGKPISLMLAWQGGPYWGELTSAASETLQVNVDISTRGLVVVGQWPPAIDPQIPDHLPDAVSKAFLQGEGNFQRPGFEDAAAMMFRRSLEIGLKTAYPQLTGSLAQVIKKLVKDQHLPSVMADWLDEVRLVGNDGAHETDGVAREDLIAARGFVDAALRYIFTLPAEIAKRRGQPPAVA